MRRSSYWFCPVVAMMCTRAVYAHHSFASIYELTRNVTVDGMVTEFAFVHPHPYLVIEATDKSGNRRSWRAEMDNRFELAGIGIAATTFKPGDRVIVNGSPGRKESSNVFVWKLERRGDGLLYEQVGSTPRVTCQTSRHALCAMHLSSARE